jgi:hypothetical protein
VKVFVAAMSVAWIEPDLDAHPSYLWLSCDTNGDNSGLARWQPLLLGLLVWP